jgi:probable F420-dependent oxidoreductase
MRIGGQIFFTDYSMTPAELAPALEERGFDSLWVPEHSHIPLSRKSPFPSGGDVPKKYYDAMDPFVVLGAAAAVTRTLLLGTGICLIAQRDPIQTAKLVASIDQVSGGRFLFGIGNGWNEDEMANHGTVFASRHKLARERVEAMKEIWTKSKAEYHGEFVNFDPMMAWPKPVQKPYPPILVGGAFPYGARRALAYGDGWMPHRSRTQYADVQVFLPKFREMAAEAGRDPASVPITLWGAKEDLDLLKRDRDNGISRTVVSLDSAKADAILPQLDRWANLIRQLGSQAGATKGPGDIVRF